MKIVIGSDHRGFTLKEFVKTKLPNNYTYYDVGCYSVESADYPIISSELAKKMALLQLDSKDKVFGILICGSGVGISIAVNKFQHIRGALVYNKNIAFSARQHNNANVICLPADYISLDDALSFINIFLHEEFEGGRHKNRVDQISKLC